MEKVKTKMTFVKLTNDRARSVFRERFGVENRAEGYRLIARQIGGGWLVLVKRLEHGEFTGLVAMIMETGAIVVDGEVCGRFMRKVNN